MIGSEIISRPLRDPFELVVRELAQQSLGKTFLSLYVDEHVGVCLHADPFKLDFQKGFRLANWFIGRK